MGEAPRISEEKSANSPAPCMRAPRLGFPSQEKKTTKLTIDFDTANDSLAWQETDEDLDNATRIRPLSPFKDPMRIVLAEVLQADSILTREWHGEICADDPLPSEQWVTDSLGYEVAVQANGKPVSYSEREIVNIRLKL